MTHWHATRGCGDESPLITDDVYAALDYVATELSNLADMAHWHVGQVARRVAEPTCLDPEVHPDEMKGALTLLFTERRFDSLQAVARHLYRQSIADDDKDRAPLYRGEAAFGEDGEVSTTSRLYSDALRVIGMVNDWSPARIWACEAGTGTYGEDDLERGGTLYCTDED
jgi:hypothetical protein